MRKFISTLYKRFFYKDVISIFDDLKTRDINDFDSNLSFQLEKLKRVLDISKNIDFYKSIYEITNFEDFSYESFLKIPILTKDIIRKRLPDLLNPQFDKSSDTFFQNTSGGSTGEPVKLFRTGLHGKHGLANYYYSLYLNGVNPSEKSIDLWGAERDMHRTGNKFDIRNILHNKHLLNTYVLSDEIVGNYVSVLNDHKPKYIKAYVHSIYEISKYIIDNKLNINFKPIIHCTTGPLYPEMRETISHAFNGAHVYNFYGSREVSAIAAEVANYDGLYTMYDNVFVEILDDLGNPVNQGEEGEVVITTLNNYYMPLIRYKIGDRAIKGDNSTFGTLKIGAVIGRTLGVIFRSDGMRIDGQFFTTKFFNKKGIKNFQLVQHSLTSATLRIVKSSEFDEKELAEIVSKMENELPGITIRIIFQDKIDLTSTGKIMYVYSELQHI